MKPVVIIFSIVIVITILLFSYLLLSVSEDSTNAEYSTNVDESATYKEYVPPALVPDVVKTGEQKVLHMGDSRESAVSLKVKGLCLDAGQGGNPTGNGQGVLDCNGGEWQKFWLDNGMVRSGNGSCLDANGDNSTSNWYWSGSCDNTNKNHTGYTITTNSQNQKALKHADKGCLDIGNDKMHYACDPANENQTLEYA